MLSTISKILPEAVAVALSPTPLIVVILILLFSNRPRRAGVTFVLGWIISLSLVVYILSFAGKAVRANPKPPPPDWFWLCMALLGLLFVAWTFIELFRPRHSSGQTHLPPWIGTLSTVGTGKSLLLGLAMGGFSLKNLALALAAVLAIQQSGAAGGHPGIALGVFVVFSSISVSLPPGYYLVSGETAQERLASWKDWLLNNSRAILLVVCLMVGLNMISSGLSGLGW